MTATPILGLLEWAGPMATPWNAYNLALRFLEQGAMWFRFIDRDLSTPPGSPAEGDCYLVATSATGEWSGHDEEIAFYMNGAWVFIEPLEGMGAGVIDEEVAVVYFDGDWIPLVDAGAATVTVTGTSGNLSPANVGKYQRWTNGSAKTLTVQPESTTAQPGDGEWHIRNAGATDLEIAEGSGVTVNPPAGGTLLIPEGGTVTLKKVATDEFDLFGVTVPA